MITFEHRLFVDLTKPTEQHRWHCTSCHKRGCWLNRKEVAQRNGGLHADWHAAEEGRPA